MYDCDFTNIWTQRSCFKVLLTAGSLCFTRDDARTFVPTIPRRRRAFTVSWNIEVFVHSNSASGAVFFSPGAPVSSFLSQPIFTVIPVTLTFNKTKSAPSLLDRRPVTKAIKRIPIVPTCVASGNIHNAVSRHLDKNRAKHRRTVFSMNKAKRASSDQRTDEEDTSETCNNNHVGGRTMTKAKKRN